MDTVTVTVELDVLQDAVKYLHIAGRVIDGEFDGGWPEEEKPGHIYRQVAARLLQHLP